MRLAVRQNTLEFGRDERITSEPVAESAERLAAVTRLLPAEDRRLIDLLLIRGLSHRAAALELSLAPGVVSRRLARIRKLLASPTSRAIADHLESLAPSVRRIAVDHFFNRMTVSTLCHTLDLTRRDVQAQLDFIRGWARALHRAAQRERANELRAALDSD